MDVKEDEIQLSINPEYCRICAALSYTECSVYDLAANEGQTLSIHMMLEALVPSVFNAEQIVYDKCMKWPTKICVECRQKVLDAYNLYELCRKSGEQLRACLPVEDILIATGSLIVVPLESLESAQEIPAKDEDCLNNPPNNRILSSRTTRRSAAKKLIQEDVHEDDMKNEAVMEITLPESLPNFSEEDENHVLSNANDIVELSPSTGKVKKVGERKKATNRKKRSETKATPVKQSAQKTKQPAGDTEEPNQTKLVPYRCLLCDGLSYMSQNELTDHLKEKHPDQIRACDKCPKVFMTEQTFQHHQYCHATGRSFFCTFCDKGFQTEQLLENHIRTHTRGTGFLCSACGKEFSDRSNLRQHEQRHTGDKPWVCSHCPSRFSTKGYLTVHLHTHSKTKFFSCTTCGSQFNRHYSLVKHQVIHTGERHYACEVCKLRFASAYHVKIHMRTHTGEKPYKCSYCGRGFAQKNDMLKHTKTHGKPYPCDRCDASFPLLADLRNHWKEHDYAGKYDAESSSEH